MCASEAMREGLQIFPLIYRPLFLSSTGKGGCQGEDPSAAFYSFY